MALSAQELFDRGLAGIRQQGCRSSKDGACKYRLRTDDGRTLKCAVGHIIPDTIYTPRMENFIDVVWDEFDSLRTLIGQENYKLACAMQRAHDRATDGYEREWVLSSEELSDLSLDSQEEYVEKAFEKVAERFGLTYVRLPWNRPAKYPVPMVI